MPRRSKNQIKQDFRPGPIGWARRRVFPLIARALALWGLLILGGWITGRILTDQHHWSQYLWWMPALWVLIAVFILGVGSLMFAKLSRRPAAVFLGPVLWLALLGCSVYVVAVMWWPIFGRAPSSQKAPGTIRALHWNHGGHPINQERFGEEVDRLGIDIVLVSNPEWGDSRQGLLDLFANYAPDDQARWVNYSYKVSAQPEHFRIESNAFIASRFPMKRTGTVKFGSNVRQKVLDHSSSGIGWVMFAEFDTDPESVTDEPLIVWFVDLPSNPLDWKQEEMQRARRAVESWDGSGWQMGRHVWEKTTFENESFPDPDLIIGDFNIPRGSDSISSFAPNTRDAFENAGFGRAKSFEPPTSNALLRTALKLSELHIDLTLYTESIRVNGYWLKQYEDDHHWAQIVDFIVEK